MNNTARTFLSKRKKRVLSLSYFLVYLVCFFVIEKVLTHRVFHVLDCELDHLIPFIPVFVIPYYFWFFYHVWALLPLFRDRDPEEYYRCAFCLFAGMSVFIIVSVVYPNTQTLRPAVLGDDIFSKMVGAIYRADTPTNIMPSIHVYNALVANTAICRRASRLHRPLMAALSVVCAISIILATLFIKQHTLYDLIGAFAIYLVFYYIFYKRFSLPECLKEQD